MLWCFQGVRGPAAACTAPVNALIRSVLLQVSLAPAARSLRHNCSPLVTCRVAVRRRDVTGPGGAAAFRGGYATSQSVWQPRGGAAGPGPGSCGSWARGAGHRAPPGLRGLLGIYSLKIRAPPSCLCGLCGRRAALALSCSQKARWHRLRGLGSHSVEIRCPLGTSRAPSSCVQRGSGQQARGERPRWALFLLVAARAQALVRGPAAIKGQAASVLTQDE